MDEKKLYFGKDEFYQIIRNVGGIWGDTKKRPLLCLIRSTDHEQIFWAIPIGMWSHRSKGAKMRIERYLNLPASNLASCYYHVGRTTAKSIFFISDVIPIVDKYIEREYYGNNYEAYIIKNPKLILELKRKVSRILYFEEKNPNYFRQHITDVKRYLLEELETPVES